MYRRILQALRGAPAEVEVALPRVPTTQDVLDAVAAVEQQAAGLPGYLSSRVLGICATVRDTAPRLDALGAGSDQAHSVVATATSYLPEALDAYLRLPREWADTRPVIGSKTSLNVLVEQLDLLDPTMKRIRDAVLRSDADALIAHGRFLQEKFGGSALDLPGTP